ncbi:MAG: type IV secretory system conjugative DNA transfer family protein, partial [Phormidesmis sp. CAN_BIN44]|nr:type IV secretory system conjugative DNA transfer family protein [Phormidesmis sp. CAN_BIN44]
MPASPAAQSAWQTLESHIAPQTPITSKLREVCDRNNSFYIAGSKGSGKGIFAANLLRWKLDQYPNAIALVLDPKGDLKESGYWHHERIRHFSFKGIALSSEQYAEKVIEFLAEARNLVSQADVTRGMRLFLVLDELLTIKETISNGLFAEFRRFGVSAISTGDSEGIHLIAITQSFNAGDSFGSDELLKNFTQVGLFREDEYTRAKKLIQFG